ncbi:NfeD family protein [Micrococcus endophyticus]|uniref:NfeD family protein n=1 Tax=Micrococcus endophyticus TaxID=455343 RepID=UPI0034CFB1C5
MDWIEANAGWLWLVAAAGLIGVELLTLDLVFLMIAAGAGAAGVVALAGGPLPLQLAAFAVVALLMLAAVRPVALRHLRKDTGAGASYLDTLPGRRVAAQGAITAEAGTLTVDGDTWSARVEAGAPDAAPGAEVTVLRVEGATLVVRPLPQIDWEDGRS